MAGTRSRKGVRFQHKANGSDGRRSSFSDASEDGSPIANRKQLEPVQEVRDGTFDPDTQQLGD